MKYEWYIPMYLDGTVCWVAHTRWWLWQWRKTWFGRSSLSGEYTFILYLLVYLHVCRACFCILAAKGITKHGGSIGGGKPPSAPTVIENAVSVRSKMSECK